MLHRLGAQNDMQKVRQFAYQQIRKLGMNDIIGPVSYDVNEENEFAVKPYSKKTARIIDEVSGEVSWLYSDRSVTAVKEVFQSKILKIVQKI